MGVASGSTGSRVMCVLIGRGAGAVRSRISYNRFDSYRRYIVVYVYFRDLFWRLY